MNTKLFDAILTVPEAAYVAGGTERAGNHEMHAPSGRAGGGKDRRAVSGADLVYLGAVREIRDQMAPALRRRMRAAITTAVAKSQPVARVAAFEVKISPLEQTARKNLAVLE